MVKELSITVYSDFACPWCYVGKARLEKAITALRNRGDSSSVNVSVSWEPYIIDLGTNPAGEEFVAYNRRRWGSHGWTVPMIGAGREDGLGFKSWKTWPHTLKAHAMVTLARGQGGEALADRVKDRIFQGIYEEGLNVSSRDVVRSLAAEAGVDVKKISDEDEKGAEDVVLEKDRRAKDMGVGSVPLFVVRQGPSTRSISGAANPPQLLRAFDDVLEHA